MEYNTRGPASRTLLGDVCLEDLGIVVEYVHDDPPAARPETTDVPGMDGTALRAIGYESRSISLECRVFRDRWHEFDRLVDELAASLLNGELIDVTLRTHPGETYRAYVESIESGDRIGGRGIGYLDIHLNAPDPYRYGKVRSVTVPSGGSVTFLVGGTRPTPVSLEASAAVRSSGSTVWGVRFDENEFMHLATGSASARVVKIDSSTRAVTVGNGTAMLTLDSDWAVLSPGRHTARMDEGTGAATLTWRERTI